MAVFLNEVASELNKLTIDPVYFDVDALRASDLREWATYVQMLANTGIIDHNTIREMVGLEGQASKSSSSSGDGMEPKE